MHSIFKYLTPFINAIIGVLTKMVHVDKIDALQSVDKALIQHLLFYLYEIIH